MEDVRYPIGKFSAKENYSANELSQFISRIESLPSRLIEATQILSDAKLDTPYRDGGWTVRQVVHHIADSHSNAYIRLKWALTENNPVIKAYDQKSWAETPEIKAPIALSLSLIEALHAKCLIEGTFNRTKKKILHPSGNQ
jgi:uncharacterized damage-inducible protein DinB